MSDVTTASRRPLNTWIGGAAAVMTTLAAAVLGGPAVEELREEAARSRRGNALSRVALAAAPDQDWSPVWDGPGGAVPDYLADMPDSLRYLTPRDGWAVTQAAASFAHTSAIEPITLPRSAAPDGYGYLPNWDLFEPMGVRPVPTARRVRVVPEPIVATPATPSPDCRPLPIAITASIAAD